MLVLQTERLNLCELSAPDGPFILNLLNTPSWLQFIGDRGVRTLEDAHRYILTGPTASYKQFGFGLYLVKLKDGNVPIGLCGLLKRETLEDVDLGFAFLPEFTGQGYAHEAAFAVLTYAQTTLGLARIVAITVPANHTSIKLLEKIGFRFEKKLTLAGGTEELLLFGS